MILIIIKILCLCIATAGAETIHGIIRNVLVVPKIGFKKSKQLSLITGIVISFVICYFMVPWIGITNSNGLLLIGMILASFMALFDIILGRYIIKQKWSVVLSDFNILNGNFLLIGLIGMIFLPLLAFRAHAVA